MQALLKKIDTYLPLSDCEKALILEKIKCQTIPANYLLIKKGEITRNIYFIENGLLSSNCFDNKGNKRVFTFHFANEIVTNHSSFLYQSEATYNIESLEETRLMYISFDDRNALIEKYPAISNCARLYYEKTLADLMAHVQNKFSADPEEKYLFLLEKHPELFQKVPLQTIAEYMNVQPQSLSRIRKRLSLSH